MKPSASRPVRLSVTACRICHGADLYVFERHGARMRASWIPDGPGPDVPITLSRVPLAVRRAAYAWFEEAS